jgi:hypothetical protein
LPYIVITDATPPNPELRSLPGASVSVTGEDDGVPNVHVEKGGKVMARVTVHVSPGVAKLVGEEEPFVQLVSVAASPAVPVVQAVAYPFSPLSKSRNARIIVRPEICAGLDALTVNCLIITLFLFVEH